MSAGLILFIHGLGGKAESTWGNFPELIRQDPKLSTYDVGYFSYPTLLYRFPWSPKVPKVQVLATALRTQIEHVYKQHKHIVLVCHSLGGLIARRYLIDEVKRGPELKIDALVLYAVPNNGAGLASVGEKISWKHSQLRQLCKDSDFIESLNEEWFRLEMGSIVNVTYIVAESDGVVDQQSAQSYWGNQNIQVILGKGHIDVVKPKTREDLSFLILKECVVRAEASGGISPVRLIDKYATKALAAPRVARASGAKYRVIAFDFDGTLLRGLQFSWTAVWKLLKFHAAVYEAGMRRYVREETTYQEWCEWACMQFRDQGLRRTDLVKLVKRYRVTKNLRRAIRSLRRDGFIVALISGGIDVFIEEAITDANELFDYICVNRLQFDNHGVISGVESTPFDFKGKLVALETICKKHHTTLAQAVFVGEGFNDATVCQKAGLSIAYPPTDQDIRAAASVKIKQNDLMKVLRHVL